MHANPSSHVQKKKRPEKGITSLGEQKEKPLCVRYVELIRLRQIVFDAESARSMRDNRLALK
jgi:hypothetical protein